MFERDEDVSAALAQLPIPEPSEEFWETLRIRCTEAFNEAAFDDSAPDGPLAFKPAAESTGATPGGTSRFLRWSRTKRGPRLPRTGGQSGAPSGGTLPKRRRGISIHGAPWMIATVTALVMLAVLLPSKLLDRADAKVPVILFPATCGPESNPSSGGDDTLPAGGQPLLVSGVWPKGSTEANNFVKVLERFKEKTGAGVVYAYAPSPRDMEPHLKQRIASHCPPDVALIPQLGLLRELAQKRQILPVSDAVDKLVKQNYTSTAREVGVADGRLYGVWFKAADKSMIWYRPDVFRQAGVRSPTTWEELKAVAARLSEKGITPFSVGGLNGWTLTDWFENVYLATAGPAMYDKLAGNEIPWDHPTVLHALTTLGQIFGSPQWMAGGTDGALTTSYEASVDGVIASSPTAAMVYEGDFVAGRIRDVTHGAKSPGDLKHFDFPAIGGSKPLVVGGDVAASLTHNKLGEQLMQFLATPEAAEIWAGAGGFLSPNKNVSLSVYPDEATRGAAVALTRNGTGRFDLSDLQPSAFGATNGMWRILQDFLRNPSDVRGTARELKELAFTTLGPVQTEKPASATRASRQKQHQAT